jgi:hypothetical protein
MLSGKLVGDVLALGSKNGGTPIVDGRNDLFWTEKFIQPVEAALGPLIASRRWRRHVRFTPESRHSAAAQTDVRFGPTSGLMHCNRVG